MRIESIRATADWLKDATYGVNALLLSVPRDTGDDAPPLLAVGMDDEVAIYDVTRHKWVGKRLQPPNLPCLYVMSEGSFDVHGEEMTGTYRDSQSPVVVTVRYVAANRDPEVASRDGEYTLRAVMQSIRQFMKQEDDAARTRNGICLRYLLRATYYPVAEAIGEARVAGAIALSYEVRDTNP